MSEVDGRRDPRVRWLVTPEQTREIVASVAISIVVTVATVGLTEGLVRAAYALRNARVESVALPYVIDDDYGPAPRWVDASRVLERDEVLLWRSRPGVQRRYVDVSSPVANEADRVLIRRFRSVPTRFSAAQPDLDHRPELAGLPGAQDSRPRSPGLARIECEIYESLTLHHKTPTKKIRYLEL